MKQVLVIILAALTLTGGAFAQVPSGRIVTVDLNRLFTEYYRTPVASQKLKDTADQYNKEHEEMLAQYRKLVDDLNKLRDEQEKTEFTAEVREQKKKAVQDKLTGVIRYYDDDGQTVILTHTPDEGEASLTRAVS